MLMGDHAAANTADFAGSPQFMAGRLRLVAAKGFLPARPARGSHEKKH
jgi:hypothetical protein